MNGYELCKKVLDDPEGGVEQLLHLANNAESEWLEFKASSVVLKKDDIEKGEKPEDLYWSVANAIIGITNTFGGAVIIGIDEKNLNVIPLKDNDPRHLIETQGVEYYLRKEIYERVWPLSGNWGTKNNYHTENPLRPDLIEIRQEKYRREIVAVILIKPSIPCLKVWKGQVEEIRHRALGDIGKTHIEIGIDNINSYENNRKVDIEAPYFSKIYQIFANTTKRGKSQKNKKKVIIALIIISFIIFCLFGTSIISHITHPLFWIQGTKNDYTIIEGTIPPDLIEVEHPLWTIEWHCIDMGIWWQTSDIQETCYGNWKLEKNRAFGNYRILDPKSFMRCWGWQKSVKPAWEKLKDELKAKEPKANNILNE